MGLAKKGSRRIEVEGRVYRWVVSPCYGSHLDLVVEGHDQPGQRLLARLDEGNAISPWLVRKVILLALADGWKPGDRGKPYAFRLEGIHDAPEPEAPGKSPDSGPKRLRPQSGQ